MAVADLEDLTVYRAFSSEEDRPAVFVLHGPNGGESPFLYEHLIARRVAQEQVRRANRNRAPFLQRLSSR